MSLIVSEKDIFQQGVQDLCATLRETDTVTQRFPFDFTDYYMPEMGKPLFRHFITFERLISIPALPDIKQRRITWKKNTQLPMEIEELTSTLDTFVWSMWSLPPPRGIPIGPILGMAFMLI